MQVNHNEVASPPSTNVAGSKRRRVQLACVSCRSRKSRGDQSGGQCSGERPRCSTCEDLGLSCQYVSSVQTEQTVVVGKEHFQAIEDRLRHLESIFIRSGGNAEDGPEREGRRLLPSGNSPDMLFHSSGDSTQGLQTISPRLDDGIGTVEPHTSMEEAGHFTFAEEEERAFSGPSSNIAFTSDLSRTLKRMSRSRGDLSAHDDQTAPVMPDFTRAHASRPSMPAQPGKSPGNKELGELTSSSSSIYYLPPEDETSALIDRYFSDTGLLYPFLHQEVFRETYAQLKHNNSSIRRTWLGLLNMVLAVATHSAGVPNVDAARRCAQSDTFYRRAQGLCHERFISSASLDIVHYLLLSTLYMQGNQSSTKTWAAHGLAVKAALQLGLHSTEACKRFPAVDREIRKRTWFTCILLDRKLSMTLGLPPSIPEAYSRLEMPIYYDLVESRERQVEARRRCRYSTDFFNATIRLYSITGDVVDSLYGGNLGCEDKVPTYELIAHVLRLRHLLVEWRSQLPGHMVLLHGHCLLDRDPSIARDPISDRFRAVLTLRYHNLRLLVHRAILTRLCDTADDHPDDGPAQDLLALRDAAGSTVKICIESASEIVGIVHAVFGSSGVRRTLLRSWWSCLYYAFDSALVLFTICLLLKRCHSWMALPRPHTLASLKRTFADCMNALRHVDNLNTTVEKCHDCLQRLAHIFNLSNDRNSNTQQPSPGSNMSADYVTSSRSPQDAAPIEMGGLVNQDLDFFDFDLLGNEQFTFMDDLGLS